MNKKAKFAVVVSAISLIALGVFFTNGCKQQNVSNAANNSSLANPASVYCINNNGTLEIRNSEQGQYGVCIKNGKECEEWTYYRGECAL